MLKLIASLRLVSFVILFAIATTAAKASECSETVKLGVEALAACEKSNEILKQLRATDAEAIKMLIEQRNKAIEANRPAEGLPFYVWLLVGGAATTILIRGVK